MNRQIKIVIADDHSMIREGLKQLLELDGDIIVIEEAANGEECLQVIERVQPDVVLLDINMPVMDGLKMLEVLRNSQWKNQKVIILTIHNEIEYLMKAIEIGIEGYVLKDADSAVLKQAIITVNEGDEYIDYSMLPLLKENIYPYAEL